MKRLLLLIGFGSSVLLAALSFTLGILALSKAVWILDSYMQNAMAVFFLCSFPIFLGCSWICSKLAKIDEQDGKIEDKPGNNK